MATETLPDAPVPDEQEPSDTDTPGENYLSSVAKEYVLTRQEQKFAVIQYVSDEEADLTINDFLEFCRGVGWAVQAIR